MFCPKCGNKLNENEKICSQCGFNNNLEQKISFTSSPHKNTTLVQQLSNNIQNFLRPIIQNIKKFIDKYKNQCLIGLIGLFVLIVGVILFNIFYGFEKLSWNNEYKNLELEYVAPTNVKLGIKFKNKEKIKDIKYDVSCGKVENNDLEIDWDLTGATGKCKITVSYKLRKISKEFTIIKFNNNESELTLNYEINLDSDEDLDFDGLTNKQEKEYKTNPVLSDTDMDGLDDNYEINKSKTEPLKKDSDNDGLNDKDELDLGLNPLKQDSKDDGIKDGNRTVTYNIDNSILGVNIEINGKGNIPSSIIDVFENPTFKDMDGLLDEVYSFYTTGIIDTAVVKIKYDINDLEKKGLKEDNLTLYYFDEDTKQLEAMPTTVDKTNKFLTVTLKHFSKYVVGDKDVVLTNNKSQIMMLIDNSISMYAYSQLKDLGYIHATGAEGNDSDFKRLTLTKKLVDMLTGNYYFGIAEFAGKYINLKKFTDDKIEIKNAVDSVKNDLERLTDGTDIVNALENGIAEFSKNDNSHYIILLTDGKDTSETLNSSKNTIISSAKEKDIKICVIGLGKNLDSVDLNEIAESTGCDYYNATDSSALDEIYSIVGADINYNLVDTDGDGKTDGTLIADSGFIVTRDGFSFGNYGTNLSTGGHCYGMATFAQLYYKKILPLNVNSIKIKDQKSYDYNLTNTYFKDYNNLYDYKLQTNILKYTFGFDIFGEETPLNPRKLDGTTLAFYDKYKNEMLDSGIYDIYKQKSELSEKEQLDIWGVKFKEIEKVYLNEDKMQTSSVIKNDDKQLLNAIYAGFIRQNVTTSYSSGSNFILWLRNVIGTESTEYPGAQGFINILKYRLNDKDAPVISSSYSGGLHAVNAISLVQDNENPNYYYIGVYDNNYPGEKRYVDIECNENNCLTVANSYYTDSGEPIRITPSLEYDLKYYEDYGI